MPRVHEGRVSVLSSLAEAPRYALQPRGATVRYSCVTALQHWLVPSSPPCRHEVIGSSHQLVLSSLTTGPDRESSSFFSGMCMCAHRRLERLELWQSCCLSEGALPCLQCNLELRGCLLPTHFAAHLAAFFGATKIKLFDQHSSFLVNIGGLQLGRGKRQV
eukprot:6131378-Prymnesium_polylepis.1